MWVTAWRADTDCWFSQVSSRRQRVFKRCHVKLASACCYIDLKDVTPQHPSMPRGWCQQTYSNKKVSWRCQVGKINTFRTFKRVWRRVEEEDKLQSREEEKLQSFCPPHLCSWWSRCPGRRSSPAQWWRPCPWRWGGRGTCGASGPPWWCPLHCDLGRHVVLHTLSWKRHKIKPDHKQEQCNSGCSFRNNSNSLLLKWQTQALSKLPLTNG